MAAILAVKLVRTVKKVLSLEVFWTDSSVVLQRYATVPVLCIRSSELHREYYVYW